MELLLKRDARIESWSFAYTISSPTVLQLVEGAMDLCSKQWTGNSNGMAIFMMKCRSPVKKPSSEEIRITAPAAQRGVGSRDRGVLCSMRLTFSVFGLLFGLALLHYISTLCMVGGCVGQAWVRAGWAASSFSMSFLSELVRGVPFSSYTFGDF